MLVIGDVHGKIDAYWKILKKKDNKNKSSIQVGDFGFKKEHEWFLKNIDFSQHKVNFGNHDDYAYLYKPHSCGNWSLSNEIMTVRGAWSIDRIHRTENISWWANEELNYKEMQQALDFYSANKPRIMITHDYPHEVRKELFGIKDKSITPTGLQAMFEVHQPEIWVFGHHHESVNKVINGTRFIGLKELEAITI